MSEIRTMFFVKKMDINFVSLRIIKNIIRKWFHQSRFLVVKQCIHAMNTGERKKTFPTRKSRIFSQV